MVVITSPLPGDRSLPALTPGAWVSEALPGPSAVGARRSGARGGVAVAPAIGSAIATPGGPRTRGSVIGGEGSAAPATDSWADASWMPKLANSDVTARTQSFWSFLECMTPPVAPLLRCPDENGHDGANGTERTLLSGR